MSDHLIIADASKVSGGDFFRMVFGKPPLTEAERAEKQRKAEEFWAARKEQNRREIEQIRDNLCKLASPELQAKFRAKWAEEDAEARDRVERLRSKVRRVA